MPVAVLEVNGSPNLLKSRNLQLTDASTIVRPKHLHVNRHIRKKISMISIHIISNQVMGKQYTYDTGMSMCLELNLRPRT